MENYYKLFGIDKESLKKGKFAEAKLTNRYRELLGIIDKEIEENHLNSKKVEELQALKQKYTEAYETLTNSKLKKIYDFKLSIDSVDEQYKSEKTETDFPSDMYSNIINQMFYKKVKGEKIEIYDAKNMRMIYLEPVGKLYYETKLHYKNSGDTRYKVRIKNLLTGEEKDAFIFTNIDKNKLSEYETYREFCAEELLSEKNIRNGTTFNGGYIGEVSEQNEKYIIDYVHETLCASIDFKLSPERRKIDLGKKKDKMQPGDICKISTRDDKEKNENNKSER